MTIEWSKVTWHSKLATIVLFAATFFLGFWLGTMNAEKVYVEVPHIIKRSVEVATAPIYVNNEFGFSFSYPGTWLTHASKFETRRILNKDLVYSISFYEPAQEKRNLQMQCLNNRNMNWIRPEPTQLVCDPLIVNLTKEEQDDLGFVRSQNIFIRVFKSDKPLREWLLATYRLKGTELEQYEIGREVKLAGESGYYSSTGCCMGIDNAYVVKRGEYIYEFGTNSDDKGLIDKYKDGFTFLP